MGIAQGSLTMRQLCFLLPGTTSAFACGGLWAELKTLELARQVCPATVVTYRQREPQTLFLADLLQDPRSLQDCIFVMSWGFDVAKLAPRLKAYPVIYHAHSAGYGFRCECAGGTFLRPLRLDARIPIITVSRNTLGYWGQLAPHSLLYYLPNEISPSFQNNDQLRDIDVLVHARKSSRYLLKELIPALEQQCNVLVVRNFVEDFAALLNRAKVYLYDSAEYWALQGVSEGFGLQPLEAIACGCQVFSSVNNGLSDYLDPGFNCQKIAGYSLDYDLKRILSAVYSSPTPALDTATLLAEYRRDNIVQRLTTILTDINAFFDAQTESQTRKVSGGSFPWHTSAAIAPLTPFTIWQLRSQRFLQKVRTKLLKR
jgi:glycosyltransferase involved in cell wall biosynthesis